MMSKTNEFTSKAAHKGLMLALNNRGFKAANATLPLD